MKYVIIISLLLVLLAACQPTVSNDVPVNNTSNTVVLDDAPKEPQDDLTIKRVYCTQRGEICTMEYDPVCGHDSNDDEIRTFSNGCSACATPEVEFWLPGECAS